MFAFNPNPESERSCFNCYSLFHAHDRMEALNGLPGPYVKWFIESIGHEGLYKLVQKSANKNAVALCYVGYSPGPGGNVEIFVGQLKGKMIPVRGDWTFGFPSFLPDGHELTLAEMDEHTKNCVSHRRKALDKLRLFLAQQKNHVIMDPSK